MAELDHNPSPQRLVGQLTIAGEVVFGDDVGNTGRDNENVINFPRQKKIPSEMEVAPRCIHCLHCLHNLHCLYCSN